MIARPVNEDEVRAELHRALRGRGATKRMALDLGYNDCKPVSAQRNPKKRINARTAAALGFELRWVKTEKPQIKPYRRTA